MHSWIGGGSAMAGSVILSINLENPITTLCHQEKFAQLTLTLAYLTNKELAMLWQIKFDLQQNQISVFRI
jgi:hypothetical protein